jgi:uncharacterized protein HemY
MNKIVMILIFCGSPLFAISQKGYNEVWKALNSGDHKKANVLIKQSMEDRSTFIDNYMTNIYLHTYEGSEEKITDLEKSFYGTVKNPYPYIYALWFNESILGRYGQKNYPHQIAIIDRLIRDSIAPGTLVAAASYQKGFHFLSSNDFKNSALEFAKVGNIKNWQYVGPFENLSGSGFNKNYGPLEHPEGKTEFLIKGGTKVKWFVPTTEIQDGWTPFGFHFNSNEGVIYAQTFVDSPNEQMVYCNFGVSGTLKAWLNDELIESEPIERVTEMDTYTQKCKLQKGTNRFLVQVSFTDVDYPNFNLRITDENHRPIPSLKGSNVFKPYSKGAKAQPIKIKHFAEEFFQDKIAKQPDNLVNYLLLTDVYLRNKKTLEARNLMEEALQKEPNNKLLRFQFITVLLKESNRSLLLEESAKLKQADPSCLFALELGIREDMTNQKYDEARKKITERESLYGEDIRTIEYKINMLAKENNYDELIKNVERSFKEYPKAAFLIPIMYAIKKNVYKDPLGAMKVYEDYLKDNYSYPLIKTYITHLKEMGETQKVLDQKRMLIEHFPYDPNFFSEMAGYYFQTKDYKEAEKYVQESLSLSPYHQYYWEQLGDIKREQKQTGSAISAYQKSLLFDANQYDVINKLRKLQGKNESYKLVPSTDVEALIKKDNPEKAQNQDIGYYILFDENSVILHPSGAVEEYCTYVVRITNEKGIDKYKESSIGYGNRQTLMIEQSEVIKKSGSRIKGEKNDNQIVFTNLEEGDVLVFKYRIQNYNYGRFAKDFSSKHFFKTSAYLATSRYNILIPNNQKINYTTTNFTQTPTIKDVEDFKQYTWEVSNQDAIKEESIMPQYVDIAPVLHVSTLSSWQDVANWYADLINNVSEESYEIKALFNKLFPAQDRNRLSQFDQARRIYNYILKNVRYSSVSFRQSAFLPQPASKTLITKLGDCKDLSNLFMTLCRMANINCYMVLVNTYDNGAQGLILPSTDFNHCIAKAVLDNKEYYIELTDNHLPFASLPNNLINAQILDIPKGLETSTLKALKPLTKSKDIVNRTILLKPDGNDLQVKIKAVKYGHLSSQARSSYANLTYEKQLKEMEETVAGSYKNNIEVDTFMIRGLEHLDDSIQYEYTYRVKDEVMEIGDLKTFKIAYPDVIASLSKFPSSSRIYPINYNEYEDTDEYETTVIVEIPEGKKFMVLPPDEVLAFKNMTFRLEYKPSAENKLTIKRKFISDRNLIPVADYPALKLFMEKISKAEQKMLAFQ